MNDHKTQWEGKFHSANEVNRYKTQDEWKIQLITIINFISSKDSDEIRTIYSKSNNKVIMMGNETDEIIQKLFESLM